MMSSSIKFSLTGCEVGCTTKTSRPRTSSSMRARNSPSGKFINVHFPSGSPRHWAMRSASWMFARPLKTFRGCDVVFMKACRREKELRGGFLKTRRRRVKGRVPLTPFIPGASEKLDGDRAHDEFAPRQALPIGSPFSASATFSKSWSSYSPSTSSPVRIPRSVRTFWKGAMLDISILRQRSTRLIPETAACSNSVRRDRAERRR